MSDFELAPGGAIWVHLVWAAPLVIIAAYWGMHRRARLLEVFGYDRARSARWLASLRRRRARRARLLAGAVLRTAAAPHHPRCNPDRTTIVSTVGAAHRWVTPSCVSARQIGPASTLGTIPRRIESTSPKLSKKKTRP